jgi:hypothetical protein
LIDEMAERSSFFADTSNNRIMRFAPRTSGGDRIVSKWFLCTLAASTICCRLRTTSRKESMLGFPAKVGSGRNIAPNSARTTASILSVFACIAVALANCRT